MTSKKQDEGQRINMFLERENHEHVQLMAGITGQTATAYVNALIAADRERNADVAEQARALAARVRLSDED